MLSMTFFAHSQYTYLLTKKEQVIIIFMFYELKNNITLLSTAHSEFTGDIFPFKYLFICWMHFKVFSEIPLSFTKINSKIKQKEL